MATLVTGGSGVLGLHVARCLGEKGETVVAYSTSGAPDRADVLLQNATARVKFIRGDILDFEHLRQTAEEFDVTGVIHTAALTGEAQARARTHEVFSVNVAGTSNVLELARLRKVRRVVYIGSASEYGRRADLQPIREDETDPEGMYAETKYLGHRLGQRYRAIFGLDVITVRISSVYGPGTRFNAFRKLVGNTLIAHLCRSAALGQAVTLDGGGDYPRDWTYAGDTANGVCRAYHAETPRHGVYNISSGRSYKVAEVVEVLRRIEPQLKVTVGSGSWADDPFQAGNLRGPLDISCAREDLGYEPQHDLETGLRKYIAWWRRIDGTAPLDGRPTENIDSRQDRQDPPRGANGRDAFDSRPKADHSDPNVHGKP